MGVPVGSIQSSYFIAFHAVICDPISFHITFVVLRIFVNNLEIMIIIITIIIIPVYMD